MRFFVLPKHRQEAVEAVASADDGVEISAAATTEEGRYYADQHKQINIVSSRLSDLGQRRTYNHGSWRPQLVMVHVATSLLLLAGLGWSLAEENFGRARWVVFVSCFVEAGMNVLLYASYYSLGIGFIVSGVMKTSADVLLAIGLSRMSIWKTAEDCGENCDWLQLIETLLPLLAPWIAERLMDAGMSTALLALPVDKVSEYCISFEQYRWMGTAQNNSGVARAFWTLSASVTGVWITVPTLLLSSQEDVSFLQQVLWWILAVGGLIFLAQSLCYILVIPLQCCGVCVEKEKWGQTNERGCMDQGTLFSLVELLLVTIPASVFMFGQGYVAGAGMACAAVGRFLELMVNWNKYARQD